LCIILGHQTHRTGKELGIGKQVEHAPGLGWGDVSQTRRQRTAGECQTKGKPKKGRESSRECRWTVRRKEKKYYTSQGLKVAAKISRIRVSDTKKRTSTEKKSICARSSLHIHRGGLAQRRNGDRGGGKNPASVKTQAPCRALYEQNLSQRTFMSVRTFKMSAGECYRKTGTRQRERQKNKRALQNASQRMRTGNKNDG